MTRESVMQLPPPSPGVGVHEPHIAIDPADPSRIAVGAQAGITNGHGGWDLRWWSTDNGGESWHHTRVPRPLFDDGFMADPFLVFTVDGAVLYFGDCAPRAVGEAIDKHHFTRFDVPPLDQIGGDEIGDMEATGDLWRMGISRSDDGGRTFTTTVIPDSADSDKPSVDVDRNPESPGYGNVYAGWAANFSPRLCVSTSRDNGRTFEPSSVIECPAPSHRFQLTVRADGSVHVVFAVHFIPAGIEVAPDLTKAIFHSYSTDAGRSFTTPRIVAHHGGFEKVSLPTFASDGAGRLLFAWGEALQVPDLDARPPQQARRRLRGIRSDDGVNWSDPYDLCPWFPERTHAGLPAVTAGQETWWMVCYFSGDDRTSVVLLRSDDGARSFELDRTLATRSIPLGLISLWGNHALAYCDDVAHPGDYIGIGASQGKVATVFILPDQDDRPSIDTAYVAVIDTN
jgi:hypothetical protein